MPITQSIVTEPKPGTYTELRLQHEYHGNCCIDCFRKYGYDFVDHLPSWDPMRDIDICPICRKANEEPDLNPQ